MLCPHFKPKGFCGKGHVRNIIKPFMGLLQKAYVSLDSAQSYTLKVHILKYHTIPCTLCGVMLRASRMGASEFNCSCNKNESRFRLLHLDQKEPKIYDKNDQDLQNLHYQSLDFMLVSVIIIAAGSY